MMKEPLKTMKIGHSLNTLKCLLNRNVPSKITALLPEELLSIRDLQEIFHGDGMKAQDLALNELLQGAKQFVVPIFQRGLGAKSTIDSC